MKGISFLDYFKKRIYKIALFFTLFSFLILSIIIFISYNQQEMYKKILFDRSFKDSIRKLNDKLNQIEDSFGNILKKQLRYIYFLYKKSGNIIIFKENFTKIKNEIKTTADIILNVIKITDINYYFISKNGVIYKTDYSEDFNLDFSKFGKIWEELKKLEPGDILITSMGREIKTGKIRLFAYIKLDNSDFFEIGIKFKNLNKLIEEEIKKSEYKGVKIKNVFIQPNLDVRTISNMKKNNYKKFSNKEIELLKQSKKTCKIVAKRLSLIKTAYYYSYETVNGVQNLKVIVFSYNLIKTLILFVILVLLIISEVFFFRIWLKKTSYSIISHVYSLANLFPKFKFDESTLEYLDNFKKSGIYEIDKIFDNYYTLVKEIISKHDKLKKSLIQLEKFNKDINDVIVLINKITSSDISINEFLKSAFRTIFEVVDEADYGSIHIITGNRILFLDAIGHDIDILNKANISKETFVHFSENVEVVNNIIDLALKNFNDEIKKDIFLKGTKTIKYTLKFSLKSDIGVYATISLDIAKESDKTFSKRSISVARLFKNLLTIYLSSKFIAERLKNILYSIGEGVIVTNNENKVILINSNAVIFLDLNNTEVKFIHIKDIFNNIEILSVERKDFYLNNNNTIIDKHEIEKIHKEFLEEEYLNLILVVKSKKTGNKKILEILKTQYYDDLGHLLGNIFTIKDITKETELNKQLIQSQKLETIGKFTGGIAHDFNNILSAALGGIELIKLVVNQNELPKPVVKELNDYIETVTNSLSQGKKFIRNMLNFTRNSEENKEIIDLHKILKDTIDIAKRSIKKNIDFLIKLEAKKHWIMADGALFENVFLNLILNSEQAIDKKDGMVRIETRNVDAESIEYQEYLYSEDFREFIEIDVIDNGKGIEKDIIDKIFEPFFTTKDRGKGTGLGLSMVYRTIKAYKGFIKVESEVDKGTIFKIFLPMPDNIDKNLKDKNTNKNNKIDLIINELKNFKKKTILVIDDEKDIREILKNMFKKSGFDVITASNGLEGIKIYKKMYKKSKNSINLVILDLLMPGMDGKETFYSLKMINPDIKVLISSGYNDTIKLKDLINDGVVDFLFKPYKMEEIIEKIYNILTDKEKKII